MVAGSPAFSLADTGRGQSSRSAKKAAAAGLRHRHRPGKLASQQAVPVPTRRLEPVTIMPGPSGSKLAGPASDRNAAAAVAVPTAAPRRPSTSKLPIPPISAKPFNGSAPPWRSTESNAAARRRCRAARAERVGRPADGWPPTHRSPKRQWFATIVDKLKKECNSAAIVIVKSGFSFRRGLTADPPVKQLGRISTSPYP